MRNTSRPSAQKEIANGAYSLGGKITLSPMQKGGLHVKQYGGYIGYITKQGEPRLLPRATNEASARVERAINDGEISKVLRRFAERDEAQKADSSPATRST